MSTSLEKSHSKASNAKLTFICFLLGLGVSAIWIGLLLLVAFTNVPKAISITTMVAGAALAIFNFILVSKFTR